MLRWFKKLDEILRGDVTHPDALSEGRIDLPAGGLSLVILLLGLTYGLCMGSYAMIRTSGRAFEQFIASTVKVPLLFFLTLLVTFPSLYVFNALIGTRLSIASVLRLLIAASGVILAVMASLGPIVVFFALSTDSYPFMVLLNVAMASMSGILGLRFMLRTLDRLVLVRDEFDAVLQPFQTARQPSPPAPAGADPQPKSSSPADEVRGPLAPDNIAVPPLPPAHRRDLISPLDPYGPRTTRKAKHVFAIWMLVFALVGAQMSWVLRPFVGSPTADFEWFRARESNFFIAVFKTVVSLFSSVGG